jgi:DNA-binding response OmpR family regulator
METPSMTEAGGPRTILVVDDEATMLELIRAILEPAGYRLVEATSATRALDLLDEAQPDLVLLDVAMPGLSGFTACHEIRRRSRARVVIVSAHASADDRARGMAAGASDYLAKPFRSGELLGVIERTLRDAV